MLLDMELSILILTLICFKSKIQNLIRKILIVRQTALQIPLLSRTKNRPLLDVSLIMIENKQVLCSY